MFFSCGNEGDAPVTFIEGTYLAKYQPEEGNPVYSTFMTFSKSGNVSIETFLTPIGFEELCLIAYSEGVYSIKGDEFSILFASFFGIDTSSFDVFEGCVPKNQLVNVLNTSNSTQKGSFIMDDKTNSFLLGYSCSETLGFISICDGSQTYSKVEASHYD